MIFNIQRFSIHDGDGIRTVIFFKGCTLHCKWCNNPESLSFDFDIMYEKTKCISCLNCVHVSSNGEILYENGEVHIHRARIREPLKYREICPAKALTVVGENKSVDEIMTEIKKDIMFYNKSNGGVTLSGGESFAQKEFLLRLLKRLKRENIHVSIETSLQTNWNNIYKCIEYIDVFLADLKHTNREKFKKFTGGNLNLVLDNFRNLERFDVSVIVRVPVIPTFNNTEGEMKEIIGFASSLNNVEEIHFIPFHTLGFNKYKLLAMKYDFFPKLRVYDHELNEYAKMAKEKGLRVKIGG